MAKQLKAKHQAEHPDYQYQPRKPNEKKRRMTQRKKAALAETSHPRSSSILNITPKAFENAFPTDEHQAPVPHLPETVGGNPMLELGDENLDDDTLAAMLEQYNNTHPQVHNQVGNMIFQSPPPVIYDEPTEEAQEQKNFYSNFNTFSTNENLSAEMEALMEGKEDCCTTLDHVAVQAQNQAWHEYLFNAEVDRMCHWNEEPVFYQS